MTSTEYIVTGVILCAIAEALLFSSLSAFGYTIHITKPKPPKSHREILRTHMVHIDGLTKAEAEDICNRMSDEEVRAAINSYTKQRS